MSEGLESTYQSIYISVLWIKLFLQNNAEGIVFCLASRACNFINHTNNNPVVLPPVHVCIIICILPCCHEIQEHSTMGLK